MPKRRWDCLNAIGHHLQPGGSGARGQGIPERYFFGAWCPSFVRPQRAAGLRAGLDSRRVEIEGAAARYEDLFARLVARNPRILLDYHFNGGGYPGVTALYRIGDVVGQGLAEALVADLASVQGLRALPVSDHKGLDGRPRAWGGKGVDQEVEGVWYPGGPVLRLLELPDSITPVVLEFFDGSVLSDYNAGLAALRSGATQDAVARIVTAHLEGLGVGPSTRK